MLFAKRFETILRRLYINAKQYYCVTFPKLSAFLARLVGVDSSHTHVRGGNLVSLTKLL